jgi:hypothetical protein
MRSAVERRAKTGDRRTKKIRVAQDRRSSFDRRKRYPITGLLRDKPWLLALLLLGVNLFSILDGVLTLSEIGDGIAREGNTIMAPLFSLGPYWAMGFKVGIVALVSLIIWKQRHHRVLLSCSLVAAVLFSAVLVYHFSFNVLPAFLTA